MPDYPEGRLVKLTATFKDSGGAAMDPNAINVTVKPPSTTAVTYTYGTDSEVTRSGVGVYHISLDTTGKPGVWTYRWWSTGTGQSATTNDFFRVMAARPVST